MTGPVRVRVDWRRKGGKKPPGVVVVGRGTAWGNPFRVGESFTPDYPGARPVPVPDAATACRFFRTYALVKLASDPAWLDPLYAATALACPGCDPADEHCHAAVLIGLMAGRRPVHMNGSGCAAATQSAPSGHGADQQEAV